MTRNEIIKVAAQIEDDAKQTDDVRAAANRLSNYATESRWTVKMLTQRLSELRRGVVTI